LDLENTYFFTATILDWKLLLKSHRIKDILISSLEFLVGKGKLKVYGFVIMPNNIHLIWRNLEMNGKEFPDERLLKFTGHEFSKHLKSNPTIEEHLVNKADRKYQFWQRSSLPIRIQQRDA
jgi:REP element-mobilizing transposase RayT